MKRAARFCLSILCAIALAGCATQQKKPPPDVVPIPYFVQHPTLLGSNQVALIRAIQEQSVPVIVMGNTLRIILPADRFFIGQLTLIHHNEDPLLDQIAALLLQNDVHITIEGHTDAVGSRAQQLRYSRAMAQSIATFFWTRGIPLSRMTIIGCGSERPIANNGTALGSAVNRRVEILVP